MCITPTFLCHYCHLGNIYFLTWGRSGKNVGLLSVLTAVVESKRSKSSQTNHLVAKLSFFFDG